MRKSRWRGLVRRGWLARVLLPASGVHRAGRRERGRGRLVSVRCSGGRETVRAETTQVQESRSSITAYGRTERAESRLDADAVRAIRPYVLLAEAYSAQGILR